ncbi:MAG: PIN domain-containing protein [Chloroflexota bacterium]
MSMADFMTDTHSLLWAFMRPKKLGESARQIFTAASKNEVKLLIPTIVLTELIFTVENKPIQADLRTILQTLIASPNVEFVSLDLQIALHLPNLTAIPEMHDRIIVASALERQSTLITVDKAITESGLIKVVW